MCVILDTCYSGIGAIPAVKTAINVLKLTPPNLDPIWFGVVTSAMDYELAQDGVFGKYLLKLLNKGPSDPKNRLRWSSYREGIRGDDFIDALIKEWDFPDQKPKVIQSGESWILFPNPIFYKNFVDIIAEHLLFSARGGAHNEKENFFSGRISQINQLVSWIETAKPGLFVVTGSSGSGKSAVLGRVVCLSNLKERKKILKYETLSHDDPGEGTVHAHIHAKGLNIERVCNLIEFQLISSGKIPKQLEGPRNRWELIGAIERAQRLAVVVIDGLNECGMDAWQISKDLLIPLSNKCIIIIGSREMSDNKYHDKSMIQTINPREIIDLSTSELKQQTQNDVVNYILKRLQYVSYNLDEIEKISKVIIQLGDNRNESLFLLAYLITNQLMRSHLDTSIKEWENLIEKSIEDAIEHDLSMIPPLPNKPNSTLELLTALTCGYGSGLPDDLWPIVANVMSSTQSKYSRDDIFDFLSYSGQFVLESGEDGFSGYQLFHQRLLEYILLKSGMLSSYEFRNKILEKIAISLIKYYSNFIKGGKNPHDHKYLEKYISSHCAIGGEKSIAALNNLVELGPNFLLSVLGEAYMNFGIMNHRSSKFNKSIDAMKMAIAIYRNKGNNLPDKRPDLARALIDIMISYMELDKYKEGLESAKEAIEIFRQLDRENDIYKPELASALSDIGNCYSSLDKREEALKVTIEAVNLLKVLYKKIPRLTRNYADALYNLGVRQREIGCIEKAIDATENAISLYRHLVGKKHSFLDLLAKSLNNLGNYYFALGQHNNAIENTERAIEIFKKLADDNVPRITIEYAIALHDLGTMYRKIGRYQDGIRTIEKAVEYYKLNAGKRIFYKAKLAQAWFDLAASYYDLGRNHDAFNIFKRSVALFRNLVNYDTSFYKNLTFILSEIGAFYLKEEDIPNAIENFRESIDCAKNLASKEADTIIASSSNQLGILYSLIGSYKDALSTIKEAVDIYRRLTIKDCSLKPALAISLTKLGEFYGELNQGSMAIQVLNEASEIFKEILPKNEKFKSEYAFTLDRIGNNYRKLKNFEQAVKYSYDAVKLIKELTLIDDKMVPTLAGYLNNLGIAYSAFGKKQLAISKTIEATNIYEQVSKDDPKYLPELVTSLNNLGKRYGEIEHFEKAIDATEKAIEICTLKLNKHPAVHNYLIKCLNNLSRLFIQINDLKKGLEIKQKEVGILFSLAKATPQYFSQYMTALEDLSKIYLKIGEVEKAHKIQAIFNKL